MQWVGGVTPIPDKAAALRQPILPVSPQQVLLPLAYGDEDVRVPAIDRNDTVVRGRPIGLPAQTGAMVYPSSVTGVFTGLQQIEHPLYGSLCCAVLQVVEAHGPDDPPLPREKPTAEQVIEAARLAGIFDERDGTALFEKLQALAGSCALLVADATEAQPFGSASLALLQQRPEACLGGLRLAALAVGAAGRHIAVQMSRHRKRKYTKILGKPVLYRVPDRYPVPRYAPADSRNIGLVGLGACVALYDAVYRAQAACCTVVTVAGDGVRHPRNLLVPFGTPAADLLAACDVIDRPVRVIFGDAFTGVPGSPDLPVLPGMSCLLALVEEKREHTPGPCIGCGRCVRACHKGLLPYEIDRLYEGQRYAGLSALRPDLCDGCGACALMCPAMRPLAETVQAAAEHGPIVLEMEAEG